MISISFSIINCFFPGFLTFKPLVIKRVTTKRRAMMHHVTTTD